MPRFTSRLHTVRDARRLSEAIVREAKAGRLSKVRSLRRDFDRVIEVAEDAGHAVLMNALAAEHHARQWGNRAELTAAEAVVNRLASG